MLKRLSGRRSCSECGAVFNIYFNDSQGDGICDRCGGPLVHRIDDEPDTVAHRLQVYEEQTAPLVAHYEAHAAGLVRVEAGRGMEEVFVDFRAAVG